MPARARDTGLPPLLPEPRSARARKGHFALRDDVPIALAPECDDRDFLSARALADAVRAACGARLPIETHGAPLGPERPHIALAREGPDGQGYQLEVGPRGVRVESEDAAGLRYGVETLAQLVRGSQGSGRGRIPACRIEDAPELPRRGIMLDVCRGKVPTAETLRRIVDLCVRLKLNVLMLHAEHTFRFRRHPRIGEDASPLDAETLRDLDRYAAERHVELIPCLQSLGHMANILALPEYAPLAETDMRWTASPAEPGTYELLADLYAEYLPNFRSSLFNANCDEPWDLERGKSAERGAELGPGGVYLEHVNRVRDLARAHGKRTMIWGDVVHAHPRRIPEIDRDLVLLDWWYEAEHIDYDRVHAFADAGLEFWVCPGTSSWNSLFPRVENSLHNVSRWAESGRKHGASGLLNTDWGDFGHTNLQGNSWLAYAWGAQEAWSGPADAKRFDRAFSQRLFADASGEAARLYRALGAVHDAGFPIFNGSALQYLFFDDVEHAYFLSAAKRGALRRSERRLESLARRIGGARERFGDDETTWSELGYAADASLLAVRKASAALEVIAWRRRPGSLGARERRALARRLRALADEQAQLARRFSRLWLARSRRSDLDDNLHRFRFSVRSLRAAAGRLERNQPSPPPEPHRGFKGAEILSEVMRSRGTKRGR